MHLGVSVEVELFIAFFWFHWLCLRKYHRCRRTLEERSEGKYKYGLHRLNIRFRASGVDLHLDHSRNTLIAFFSSH